MAAVVLASCAAAWSLCAAPSSAHADSDSWATLGLSGKMVYQGPSEQAGENYLFGMGLRAELLYLFGAEFEYAPMSSKLSQDIYRTPLRLTGQLHLMNYRYFDFYLGAGLASDRFGDLVNPEGPSTVYRVGAGMEVIIVGHWALGVDAYWHVPGVGHFNKRLRDSLQNEQGIPDPMDQVDPGQVELGVALRFYL